MRSMKKVRKKGMKPGGKLGRKWKPGEKKNEEAMRISGDKKPKQKWKPGWKWEAWRKSGKKEWNQEEN